MEHSLHLSAHHFVKGVTPTPGHAVLKKVHTAFQNTQWGEDRDLDLDGLNEELGGIDDVVDCEYDSDDEDEEGVPFSISDTIGKALALLTQV